MDILKRACVLVWLEYGQTIVSAFHLTPGSTIDMAPVVPAVMSENVLQMLEFISRVRGMISEIKKIQYIV